MEYFKVKSVLPKNGMACKVEVLDKGATKPNKFGQGMVTEYDIKLNDKDLLRWDASDSQVQRMKECGVNPFIIKRYDTKQGNTGFNFLPPDDVQALPQNCEPSISHAAIQRKVDKSQDEYQDKVSRGAAWNCAFSYALKNCPADKMDDFLLYVATVGEEIAVAQKIFVNGNSKVPVKGLENMPEAQGYEPSENPVDDLPF